MATVSPDDLDVRPLLEAIYRAYGYDFRGYALAPMRRRAALAMSRVGAKTIAELSDRVVNDKDLFATLVDALTVQVSEIFRDPSFFVAFRERVVPVLRTYPQLRFWLAGCSAGEEAYAVAILLAEEGLYDRAQLYATDLSASAIAKAKAGVYSARLVDKFATNHVAAGGIAPFERYYRSAYDRIVIKEYLKRNVLFFQHDLVSDDVPGEMHVIFCRNVLIYFAEALQTRVRAKLERGLIRGGFLCLGLSEHIAPEQRPRLSDVAPRERIYRLLG